MHHVIRRTLSAGLASVLVGGAMTAPAAAGAPHRSSAAPYADSWFVACRPNDDPLTLGYVDCTSAWEAGTGRYDVAIETNDLAGSEAGVAFRPGLRQRRVGIVLELNIDHAAVGGHSAAVYACAGTGEALTTNRPSSKYQCKEIVATPAALADRFGGEAPTEIRDTALTVDFDLEVHPAELVAAWLGAHASSRGSTPIHLPPAWPNTIAEFHGEIAGVTVG